MKFYKDQLTATSIEFVAYEENGADAIRVTYWEGWGYRAIEKCMVYDDSAGVAISQEEFLNEFRAAHAEMLKAAHKFAGFILNPPVSEAQCTYDNIVVFTESQLKMLEDWTPKLPT